jgi:hypothetical protein
MRRPGKIAALVEVISAVVGMRRKDTMRRRVAESWGVLGS